MCDYETIAYRVLPYLGRPITRYTRAVYKRFSKEIMAEKYEKVYYGLTGTGS